MYCTNCGTEFEGKFCPNCGTPAATGNNVPNASSNLNNQGFSTIQSYPIPPKKKKRKGVIVVIIVLIVVAGLFFISNVINRKNAITESVSVTEPENTPVSENVSVTKAESTPVSENGSVTESNNTATSVSSSLNDSNSTRISFHDISLQLPDKFSAGSTDNLMEDTCNFYDKSYGGDQILMLSLTRGDTEMDAEKEADFEKYSDLYSDFIAIKVEEGFTNVKNKKKQNIEMAGKNGYLYSYEGEINNIPAEIRFAYFYHNKGAFVFRVDKNL